MPPNLATTTNPYLATATNPRPLLVLAAVLVAFGLVLVITRHSRLGWPLLAIALLGSGAWWLSSNWPGQQPLIFSERAMLEQLWANYQENYFTAEGRTIDWQRGGITTSEGQAYTMLRAAWLGDKETFDQTWRWTERELRRQDNGLFAWLYGPRAEGGNGILVEQGGNNTASDADIDIALALLFAHGRWPNGEYRQAAAEIIPAIWREEVVMIGGHPYLAANNLEKESPNEIMINPSYFSPAAFRLFANIDPDHDWVALANSSYELINRSIAAPLGGAAPGVLPPDWLVINRHTGALSSPPTALGLSTRYGYDALRLPWRIALDVLWFDSAAAHETLSHFAFLNERWQNTGQLSATYTHTGEVYFDFESPAMYGGTLGYFLIHEPLIARQIYRQKLVSLYSPDAAGWRLPLSYYDDNLAWFGLALYNQSLPNLSDSI